MILERHGDLALIESIKHRRYKTVNYLLKNSNIHTCLDDNGRNALMVACLNNSPLDVIEALLEKININDRDNEGNTALLLACQYHAPSLQIIKCLVEKQNNVTQCNYSDNNVLFYIYNNVEIIQYLINSIDNSDRVKFINQRNYNNDTPLLEVCKNGASLNVIKYLVNNGALLNVNNNIGMTPLSIECVFKARSDVIQYLVKHDSKLCNIVNSNNDTPLMLLLKNSCMQFDSIKYLVNNGTDLNVVNHDGMTAFSYVCSNNYPIDIVKYFVNDQHIVPSIKDCDSTKSRVIIDYLTRDI